MLPYWGHFYVSYYRPTPELCQAVELPARKVLQRVAPWNAGRAATGVLWLAACVGREIYGGNLIAAGCIGGNGRHRIP